MRKFNVYKCDNYGRPIGTSITTVEAETLTLAQKEAVVKCGAHHTIMERPRQKNLNHVEVKSLSERYGLSIELIEEMMMDGNLILETGTNLK